MKLWIAQGFGIGRIAVAPGTFGSLVGLGWLAVLLAFRSWPVFVLGNLAGIAVSVWLCGEGERILGRKDPGSVVLDEIVAIPLCFAGWLVVAALRQHSWPGPEYFWAHWLSSIGVFALFRLFDVAKPWPVRQSQVLAGGWGVTIDDVLAAVYVNLVVLAILMLF
ncbi:MAG TPA: phosphatidylglycerophosphatase A [Candidatus Baltobacteraceae bacterium]|jgi:phosphatidylglycerophosphatase A|nr:phosphatidylglycerophosphatase A [Candidatus Baltobacteraceae bacterium]